MDMQTVQANEATPQLDIGVMRAHADNACRMMKTLANRDRLMLLCQLSQGEKRVGELEEATNIQQPTLSQQLAVLREENVVSTRTFSDSCNHWCGWHMGLDWFTSNCYRHLPFLPSLPITRHQDLQQRLICLD